MLCRLPVLKTHQIDYNPFQKNNFKILGKLLIGGCGMQETEEKEETELAALAEKKSFHKSR